MVGGLVGQLPLHLEESPSRVGPGEESSGQEELGEAWVADATPPWFEGTICTAGGMQQAFLVPVWEEFCGAPQCHAADLGGLLSGAAISVKSTAGAEVYRAAMTTLLPKERVDASRGW